MGIFKKIKHGLLTSTSLSLSEMIKAADIERFVHAPLFFPPLDTFCSGLYLELSCFVLSHSTPTCGENPSPLDEKPPALYAIFTWTGSDLLGKK